MHRIEIDDEIYAHLERNVKGFEQPNDVLRRLLFGEIPNDVGTSRKTPRQSTAIPGKLRILLENDKVKAGDVLTHTQVRKDRTFTATIEQDGWIKTEKGRFKDPSPALGAFTGTSVDGWANWIHEPTGKPLGALRSEIGDTGRRRGD